MTGRRGRDVRDIAHRFVLDTAGAEPVVAPTLRVSQSAVGYATCRSMRWGAPTQVGPTRANGPPVAGRLPGWYEVAGPARGLAPPATPNRPRT